MTRHDTTRTARTARTTHDTRHTHDTQQQNLFNSLQAITVPEKNFTVLRDRMSTSAPPKIPYIGTSLADLTFIEDGNPDYHDGLINFTKRHLLFGIFFNHLHP
jgi:hypothetical protein